MILPLRHQVGYASGNLGKSMLWTSLDYMLLFYLTDVEGIAADVAGAIVLISLLWDGAINPVIGYWIDRRAAKGMDYRPFLRWGAPAASLAFMALFIDPFTGLQASTIYLFMSLLLFRSIYALCDVPHNALLAHMPIGAQIRTRLAGMRFFFSSLGGLAVAWFVAPQLTGGSVDIHRKLIELAAIASLFLCLTLWQSLWPARHAMMERLDSSIALNPLQFVKAIIRNKAAATYLGLAALFAATTPLFAKSLPYLFTYVRGDVSLLPVVLVAMTIGQMVAMPIWTALAGRFGHVGVGITSLLGLVVVLGVNAGMEGSDDWLITSLGASVGFFLGGATMIIWALAGEIADHIARSALARTDAGLLAFLTLVQKAGIGVGAMAVGLVLRWSDFQPGHAQSDQAQAAIKLAAFGLPAVGAALSALVLFALGRGLHRSAQR